MTMPRSLTSSRYTGAPARRSLERTSVVSIITFWPIHASGIGPPCGAAGLSLSIMVHSCARFHVRLRIPPPNRDQAYFRGPQGEVPGTPLPRTPVNRVPGARVGVAHGPARERRPLSTPGAVGKGGRRLAVLALVATMTIWGSSFVVTTLVLDEAGAFAVTGLRFCIRLLGFLPFGYRRGFPVRRDAPGCGPLGGRPPGQRAYGGRRGRLRGLRGAGPGAQERRGPPGGRGHGGELRRRAPLPHPTRRGRGDPLRRAGPRSARMDRPGLPRGRGVRHADIPVELRPA